MPDYAKVHKNLGITMMTAPEFTSLCNMRNATLRNDMLKTLALKESKIANAQALMDALKEAGLR